MNEFARNGMPAPSPAPEAGPRGGPVARWFPWWVALCLVVLAWSTYRQLSLQRHILQTSELLRTKVGEAAQVSEETNLQLGKVAELDRATLELAGKLQRVGQINASLRTELTGLEGTVEGLYNSVATLDEQAGESRDLLGEIIRQSDLLQTTLRRSQQTSGQVAAHVSRLVSLQEAVNADLSEMNVKTRPLERLGGGE